MYNEMNSNSARLTMALSGCIDMDNVNITVAGFSIVLVSILISSTWKYILTFLVLLIGLRIVRQRTVGKIDVKGQAVFITGCDTGFGHDLAVRLDQLGFTVFAGCLYPKRGGATKLRTHTSRDLHIIPLDVGQDESVLAARDYVVKHLPETGLWAIVNNAGIGLLGDVELLTSQLYHRAMDVNFYGAVRTIRAFLYLVRKTKGRVVTVTSVHGLISEPGWSAYEASKHALETVVDSLRLEMVKFGVKVAKIQPGDYCMATGICRPELIRTLRHEAEEMWHEAVDDVRKTYTWDYSELRLQKCERLTVDAANSAPTTKPIIDAMVDAIMSERPRTSYLVDGGKRGIDPQVIFARFNGYLPTFITDWVVCWWTYCDKIPDYSDQIIKASGTMKLKETTIILL